ncbi:MAG: YcjX family protein [Campylobacterales bacterium]
MNLNIKNSIKEYKNSIKEYTTSIKETPILKPSSYKIAITGLSRAGKTVFITSLIDQLLHRDKIPFVTDKKSFRVELEAPSMGTKRFDYYTLIDRIKKEHIWPKGTDEITSIKLKVERKRSSLLKGSAFTIELIDYPGEWLLDLSLINLSFKQWCQKTKKWLQDIDEPESREYLELISKEMTNGELIVRKYKELLNVLRDRNYTFLIPGRFVMPSDLDNDPLLGFAPIEHLEASYSTEFEEKYKKYVEDIVKNIQLEYFRGFDRQIILVDVIKALQNGHKCYEDMRRGLDTIVSLYDHKKHSFLKKLFTPTIKKVILAAPKCDLLSASQHQNYKELLHQMTKEYKENLEFNNIKASSHIFASLKCTQTVKRKYEGMILSSIRGIDPVSKELKDHYPGEMPPSFPKYDEWKIEDYNYKEVFPPKKEYRVDEALDHTNMDEIINELLGDIL